MISSTASSESFNNHASWLALFAALASPSLYGVVNLVDKLAIDRRVKFIPAYVSIVGIFDVFAGIVIGCCSKWNKTVLENVPIKGYIFAIAAGMVLGFTTLLYYFALEKMDATKVVGAEYSYPVIVCILSYFILKEPIGIIGYIGIALTLFGAIVIPLDLIRLPFTMKHCSQKIQALARINDDEAENEKSQCEKNRCCVLTIGRILPLGKTVLDDERKGITAISPSPSLSPNGDELHSILQPLITKIDSSSKLQLEEQEQHPVNIQEEKETEKEVKGEKERKTKWYKAVLLLVPMIFCVASNEFLSKLATIYLPGNNVAALNSMAFGLTLFSVLLIIPSARKNFVWELKTNWKWAFLSEVLTVGASWLLIISMSNGLSAPIASSLSATQPFCILLLEFLTGIANDTFVQCLSFKLIPISFVIGGVVLISLSIL